MEAVEPAGVPDQRALPRHGHGEEQGVESRVVEAFADVTPCGEDEPRLVLPDTGELRRHLSPLARVMPPRSTTRCWTNGRRRVARCSRWFLRSVSRIGDRRSWIAWDDVVQDQPVPALVPGQGGVQGLNPLGWIERASDERRVARRSTGARRDDERPGSWRRRRTGRGRAASRGSGEARPAVAASP